MLYVMNDVRIVVGVMELIKDGRLYSKKRYSHNAREKIFISIILYGYDDKKIFSSVLI